MADHSSIEWTDATWSPWIGCTKVSPACDGCYAAHLMDTRLGRVEWGPHGKRSRTSASYWRKPLAWDREAAAAGRMMRVFPSLCDPFDRQADPTIRAEWFELMRRTPHLLWLLLTKRPQNAVWMSRDAGGLPPNVALGATCEDRKRVEINLPALVDAGRELRPAYLFGSFEPLLGSLGDLSPWLTGETRLGQCITGGETSQGDHKSRPTHPTWYREVQDQCAAAGVAYLHKQNGEWVREVPRAGGDLGGDMRSGRVRIVHVSDHTDEELCRRSFFAGDIYMRRVGKARAGRLLDGVEHDGMPEVQY